jgi:serine/threonine protein kinase
MATVYLARMRGHGGFEQDVALKVTHAHLRESPEFVNDLVQEAMLASRIRHRNVVSIVDVGDDPLGAFLVMEYIEGDTLGGLRRRAQGIPPKIAVRILLDALAGLQAAHELCDEEGRSLGLVHRDFCPQNILVGTDGVARLADFGIAKAQGRVGNTSTGLVRGKTGYMAPEQARGEQVDRRADTWAAGVVAWEVLANRRLYPSEDAGLIFRVASEMPPRLRAVVPAIHGALDDVVAHALTPRRDKRVQTALAFSKELAAACREAGEIAEHDEVAEFVKEIAGPKLAERRAAALEVRRLRIAQSPMSQPVRTSNAPDFGLATASLHDSPATDTSSVSGAEPHSGRRRFAVRATGALVFLTIAAVSWLSVRPTSRPTSAPKPVATSSPTSSGPDDQGSLVPATSEPRAPSATTSPVTLAVTANAPIASLSIDGTAIPVPRPSREIDATLAMSALVDGAQVRAVAVDGRRASARLTGGSTVITLAFVGRLSGRPAGAVAAPPLGPDPYPHGH